MKRAATLCYMPSAPVCGAKNLGVAYKYIDVDLLSSEERDKIEEEVKKWNPRCSFPTLVFNQKSCVVGFKEYEIKLELKK